MCRMERGGQGWKMSQNCSERARPSRQFEGVIVCVVIKIHICIKQGTVSKKVRRCLTSAVGCMVVAFTEMGKMEEGMVRGKSRIPC